MYIEPKYYGTYSDGYGVYGFDVGTYHPNKTSLKEAALINAINSSISKITDTTVDLKLGILFNHHTDRMMISPKGDMYLHGATPHTHQSVAFATLYT